MSEGKEDLDELREAVREFLAAKSGESAVRAAMDTGYDPAVWDQMARQLRLPGLALPSEYGGDGFGLTELEVVLEEMGAALLCSPFFATVVLAAQALLASADEAACARYLPGIAAGQTHRHAGRRGRPRIVGPGHGRDPGRTGGRGVDTERKEELRDRRGDRGPGTGRGAQHRRAGPVRGGPRDARPACRADDHARPHPPDGHAELRPGARGAHRHRGPRGPADEPGARPGLHGAGRRTGRAGPAGAWK